MKKMNYIYKVSAAVVFAAAMILSASCSKERQFKGDVTGSAEVRFEAAVASNTTSVTTKSGVLTGADGISIPFTMVSEPGINGGAGDAIDTKGTLYNTTGEDMALAAAGINKFRVAAFNQDKSYFIPAMTDVNYADGKWSTATPYTWAGGEEKLFVAFGNFDGDITFSLDDGSLSGSFAQDIPDEASAQKEILISGYAGNGDSDEDGICDGEVSMIFQHLNTSVVFKMGDMLGVSKIKRIALENVLARREFSFDEEFDITHGDVEPVKTVWQDVNALPEVGEQVGEAFILHEQGLENVILHVYVTISGRDYDLVARLGSDTWMAGNTNVYTLGFGDTVVEPLCITAEDEQSVIFVRMRYNDNTEKTSQLGYPDATIFYSFDKKQWVEWTDFSESVTFGTGEHPSIYLIGSNPDGFGGIYDSENRTYDGSVLYFLHENTEINISGNIMSLIDYSEKLTEFPAGTSGHFAGLFAYAPVRSAADLVLPVNTLSTLCYTGMFAFCSKLQTPPALPAKTMAPYCYHNLFYGCSSLATAPEMPAMNLASYCYWGMYKFCSSLTTAPALPAETLADNCYRDMFDSCTGLQTAPVLPAKTLADGCYMYMFDSCTNLQIAPVLPAATLVENCYRYMFSFCENLNRIEMLATDITAPNCLGSWTSGVPETGTFVKSPALGTRTNASDDNTRICLDSENGIPTGWTVCDIIEPVVEPVCFTSDAEQNLIMSRITYLDSFTPGVAGIKSQTEPDVNLWYSYDKNTWLEWTSTMSPVKFGTAEHPSVYVIGKNPDGFNGSFIDGDEKIYIGNVFNFIDGSGNPTSIPVTVSGNIMSLIDYSEKLTAFPAGTEGQFVGLFAFSPVTDASGLVLPVKTLAPYCYTGLFAFCPQLENAPVLSATTLADYCYTSMFESNAMLSEAPALPAMTLAPYCYRSMFANCTSLAEAPALPSTSLAYSCYDYMFAKCTSLVEAPELLATTLVERCYWCMFSGCSNLNYIKMLATDITAANCLTSWTSSVAETGTFVKDPSMTALPSGTSGIPTGWTVVDATE